MLGRTLLLTCVGLLLPAACSGTKSGDGTAGAEAGGGGEAAEPAAGGSAAGETDGAGAAGGEAGAAVGGGAAGETGTGGADACGAVVEEHALAAGIHVEVCSAITYATNPPSSGSHYGVWADFGVYDFALPRGYWVHNLEHGAVAVTYNCPEGCADEVATAKQWLAGLSPDATCPSGPPRALLMPDPALEVRWAASAWGFTLQAGCFDAAAFSDFYASHAGKPPAPEADVCGAGADFRAEGANTCGAK